MTLINLAVFFHYSITLFVIKQPARCIFTVMNKTILITGATSGIGKACAEKFAAARFNLIITGRRKERLEEIAAALAEENGIKVLTSCFDVQNREAIITAIQQIPDE